MNSAFDGVNVSLAIIAGQLDPDTMGYEWCLMGYHDTWKDGWVPPSSDELKGRAVEILTDCITDILAEIHYLKSELRRENE